MHPHSLHHPQASSDPPRTHQRVVRDPMGRADSGEDDPCVDFNAKLKIFP